VSDLISVEEADARIAAIQDLSPPIQCPLSKAAGRVLREDLRADRPLPPFDRVMMDGYALRYKAFAEACSEYRITDMAHAGEPQATLSDLNNAACEIMTGAPLPKGADVVVPYEVTERTGERMRLLPDVKVESGQYIHRLGSDFAEQSILAKSGSKIGPVVMGVAASCGYAEVLVSPRPRIAVVGTGDELVPVNEKPEPHQIRASNAATLECALALAGYHVGEIAHWPDDPKQGNAAMSALLDRNDVVIIAGAVSKGQRDWIPGSLDTQAECIFHGVRQRPGKPMGLWRTAAGCTIFALPGNPVSALVGLHRYVLPYLKKRDGGAQAPTQRAPLAESVKFEPPMTWFLPVALDAQGAAEPRPVKNSGDYARLVGSDGFIELPNSASEWTAGFEAPFYPWSS